jgi:hypothetical protein
MRALFPTLQWHEARLPEKGRFPLDLDRAVKIFLVPPSGHVQVRHRQSQIAEVPCERLLLPELVVIRMVQKVVPRGGCFRADIYCLHWIGARAPDTTRLAGGNCCRSRNTTYPAVSRIGPHSAN